MHFSTILSCGALVSIAHSYAHYADPNFKSTLRRSLERRKNGVSGGGGGDEGEDDGGGNGGSNGGGSGGSNGGGSGGSNGGGTGGGGATPGDLIGDLVKYVLLFNEEPMSILADIKKWSYLNSRSRHCADTSR